MAEQINQLILSPILFGREFGVSLSATYNAVWLMVGGEMPFDKSGPQKNLAQGHSFVPVIYPLNQKNIDAINGLHPDYYDLNEVETKKYLDEKYSFVSLYLDALIKE